MTKYKYNGLTPNNVPRVFSNCTVIPVFTMLRKRPASILLASCALVAMCDLSAFAADLTLFGATRSGATSVQGASREKPGMTRDGKDKRPGVGKKDRKKNQAAQAEKDRQRIVTYSLFRDPLSRVHVAADHRQIERLAVLGAPSLPQPAPHTASKSARVDALRTDEPDTAGIAFGCRERPFSTSMNKRELAACFRHNVDRSWKAQTYVSRGYADGIPTWGGGLSLAYDY